MNDQYATEVAQIERELEILRARYALMARWARVSRVFVSSALVVLAVALAGGIIYAFATDVAVAMYIVAVSMVAAAAVWIGRDTESVSVTRTRPSQFLPTFKTGLWYRRSDEMSDAETIREMIALRERRLAELKISSS